MLSIPLYVFLFIYFFFLLGFAAFFLINATHLVRTGTMTLASFSATVVFLAFSAIILLFTFFLLRSVNWQELVTLWDMDWLGSIFSNNFISP